MQVGVKNRSKTSKHDQRKCTKTEIKGKSRRFFPGLLLRFCNVSHALGKKDNAYDKQQKIPFTSNKIKGVAKMLLLKFMSRIQAIYACPLMALFTAFRREKQLTKEHCSCCCWG